MPQITLLPSFGEVLSSDEKLSNQSILVSTSGIENTQAVSIAITNNPNISYVQALANNSATVSVPASDLQQLTGGKSYKVTASVSNIFGDIAAASLLILLLLFLLVPLVEVVRSLLRMIRISTKTVESVGTMFIELYWSWSYGNHYEQCCKRYY